MTLKFLIKPKITFFATTTPTPTPMRIKINYSCKNTNSTHSPIPNGIERYLKIIKQYPYKNTTFSHSLI